MKKYVVSAFFDSIKTSKLNAVFQQLSLHVMYFLEAAGTTDNLLYSILNPEVTSI